MAKKQDQSCPLSNGFQELLPTLSVISSLDISNENKGNYQKNSFQIHNEG